MPAGRRRRRGAAGAPGGDVKLLRSIPPFLWLGIALAAALVLSQVARCA